MVSICNSSSKKKNILSASKCFTSYIGFNVVTFLKYAKSLKYFSYAILVIARVDPGFRHGDGVAMRLVKTTSTTTKTINV